MGSRLNIVVLAAVVAVTGTGATAGRTSSDTVHPSGIRILQGELAEPGPLPRNVSAALDSAMRSSAEQPAMFGYPFVSSPDEVVVAASGSRDAPAVQAAVQAAREAAEDSVRVAVVPVSHSRKYLDQVMDDVIGLQPEGLTVKASYPDPEKNRIIAEVGTVDDAFLYRLARKFDSSSIAILVTEEQNGDPASRESDTSPFYGGANVNGCTTGFSWHSGSTEMMLTAGHCFSSGGSASTPVQSMGAVNSTSEENWDSGTGTVLMTGEATSRGDLALIRIPSGKYSSATVFRGGYDSGTTRSVAGKWARSPAGGDQYCTSGRRSGELCGWVVQWSAAGNYTYSSGDVARRVWRGDKRDYCIIAGDSGGPVYTVNSSGQAVAKGVISGATGFGGSDNFAGYLDTPCRNIFTDIWDAYYSMPGDIN